jgi:hypothetical protein
LCFHHLLNALLDRQNPQISDELLLALVAEKINVLLSSHGKCWTEYPGLPSYNITLLQSSLDQVNRLIQEELSYERRELEDLSSRSGTLNLEQKNAFNQVMECVNSNASKIFFIDGPGGSGKTYLYNTILGTVRNLGKIALAVASSGIAAMLLLGGRTAHSRFKINFDKSNCACNISR